MKYSQRRVQIFCTKNRIDGVFKLSKNWAISDDGEKPIGNRRKGKIVKTCNLILTINE